MTLISSLTAKLSSTEIDQLVIVSPLQMAENGAFEGPHKSANRQGSKKDLKKLLIKGKFPGVGQFLRFLQLRCAFVHSGFLLTYSQEHLASEIS